MSRPALLALVLSGIAACALTACGGGGGYKGPAPTATVINPEPTTTAPKQLDQDAADFQKKVVKEEFLGQYGREWDTLHPLQQAFVPRARWVNCESIEHPVSFTLDKIDVLDRYGESVRIPGRPEEVPSTAVKLRLTYDGSGLDKPQTFTTTVHAAAVNGQWRWILAPDSYRAYKAHRCPSQR